MGEHAIIVKEVRPIDIHGSQLIDLVYVLDTDPQASVHICRIGPESVEGTPQPGDRLIADFALRQMTRVRRG